MSKNKSEKDKKILDNKIISDEYNNNMNYEFNLEKKDKPFGKSLFTKSIKYSIDNIGRKEEKLTKEIDVEINSYENFINNEKSEINEIKNNNMNGFISEIKINSNNQILNSNNNDFDYSEVLPIIDKVSKLKDINEIEDNYDKQKTNALNTQRMNLTNSNININSNEDEEVPNIVNSILDALSNKLITSNLENNQENEKKIEKPKLISKNNNLEDRTKKIISFKEFLAKDDNNKDET